MKTMIEQLERQTPLGTLIAQEVEEASVVEALSADDGSGALPVRLARPLFMLAIGGSGRMIATHLKAILIEHFGAMPENAVIMVFDSADEPMSVREGRSGQVIELEAEHEFFLLGRVPIAGVKRYPDRHPEIVERLGPALKRIHRASIQDGAAQERPQGLVSWVWNVPRTEELIESAIRRLEERNEDLRHEIEEAVGINVIIAGSVCGGQNSGAMLDAAYLVREKLAELGDLADSSQVVGLLVLPGAFSGRRGPRLKPNTYGFFQELDRLMQGSGFEARYPGNLRIQSSEQPFDQVFVLDGVDEQGKTWPNWEEVCGLGARAMALLYSSDVGMSQIAHAVNQRGVLQGISADGYGTYLATVGQAVIRFPARQVAERCSKRYAQAMIGNCLLAVGQDGEEDSLPAITSTAVLRDRLRKTSDGAPFHVQLVAPASLEQSKPEEVPSQARSLVTNYMQRRIYGGYFKQMKESRDSLKSEMADQLSAQLSRPLAQGSLLMAVGWLRRAKEGIEQQYASALAQEKRLTEAAEEAQARQEAAEKAMERTAGGFALWRKRQAVQDALAAYLGAANRVAAFRLEQRVEELAGERLHDALQWAQGHLTAAEAVTTRLTQASEQLARQEDALARLALGRSEINLAEPEVVDEFYHRYADDVCASVREVIDQTDGVLSWAQQTPDQLVEHLTAAARRVFEPLLHVTVEEVLARRWDDRSAQQWIARLEDLAAGAWNLDRALLPGGGTELASFLTLGVPEESTSIFANSGYTLVSTHDPERIVALRTIHGASFDTLKQAAQWKRAYERVAPLTPLHVLPDFLRAGDDSSGGSEHET